MHTSHPTMTRLYVYGELFGGHYPHPDITSTSTSTSASTSTSTSSASAVQTGVWYAPDLRFCAFDIAYDDATGQHTFIDYGVACELFKQVCRMTTTSWHVTSSSCHVISTGVSLLRTSSLYRPIRHMHAISTSFCQHHTRVAGFPCD